MSAYGKGSYADYENRARTNIANSGISKLGKTRVTPERLQEEMTRMGAPRSPWEEAGIPFPQKGQPMGPMMGQSGMGPSGGFMNRLQQMWGRGQQQQPQMGQGGDNSIRGPLPGPMPEPGPESEGPQGANDQMMGGFGGMMGRPPVPYSNQMGGGMNEGWGRMMPQPQMGGGMFGGYGQQRPQPPMMGRMGQAMMQARQMPLQNNRPMPQMQGGPFNRRPAPMQPLQQPQTTQMRRPMGNKMGGIGPSMM